MFYYRDQLQRKEPYTFWNNINTDLKLSTSILIFEKELKQEPLPKFPDS